MLTPIKAQLPYRGFVVTGADAKKFLQGQLTQDMRELGHQKHCYAAYCTEKGRMLANFLIREVEENHYILRVDASVADSVMARLKNYVLRSKVNIEPIEDLVFYGINKAAAESIVQTALTSLPEPFHYVVLNHKGDSSATVTALPNDCYEFAGNALDASAFLVDMPDLPDRIYAMRMQGGHFDVTAAISEQILPQQTALEKWGISYHKGCYVGQEIVARNKYLGQVKKGLAFARFTPKLLPAEGANDLYGAVVMQGDKPVGKVMNVHQSVDVDVDETLCLAMVALDALNTPLTVNGQTATFSLPQV